jgi:hypothetical protein
MVRKTRPRAAQKRDQRAVDILNGVAAGQEDDADARATNIEQHIAEKSVDHEHGDGQRQMRQTRRSARLNEKTARDVTPAPENNIPEPPDSPLFVVQDPDYNPEAAVEEADEVDKVDEADEADEAEDERGVEEDGDLVESEEDTSMSDHEQQLWQEQEQAIASSQQEQEQALATSPVLVVIDRGKEKVRGEDAATTRAAEIENVRGKANYVDFFGGDDEFADSESDEEDENDEGPASDDSFDMDDSRHEMGTDLRNMFGKNIFDWDGQQSVEPAEPIQRPRIVDRLETQPPQTSGSSSRKRRRASIDSTDTPDRTRRRREPPNQNIESAASRRPPVARGSSEVADWEVIILEEGAPDKVIVVGESITYDDATKIQDLQGTWKRLIKYCQKLKDIEVRRMRRYVGIEAIVERISDLLKDYKRMQRTRSRGRAIDPDTWKRTRREVKYISEDADKIRKVILRRAKEGKDRNDLQAQADAVEYAELIVQQVMTSLCELALECLKTYYSEEDEWLLNGGFGAVLDIIDIVGELDLTLTSLHNCAMVVLSPYPGRPIRQELRSIRGSLKNAEADEQRRGR